MKRRMNKGDILPTLKETYGEWNNHKAPRLGAALAYYTVFSIGPLLFIILQVVGLIYRGEGARRHLSDQISTLVGPVAAQGVISLMGAANHPAHGFIGAAVGFITLLAGAAGLFGQLQDALNTIWEVAPKPGGGILTTLKDRFASFTMVAGSAFLLMVSLVATTVLAVVGKYFQSVLPIPGWIFQIINFLVSFGVITLLFALIYKVLPDAKIAWRDVWFGAAITSLLFTIGKLGLGFYLGRSSMSSGYGAAGSLMLLLLWVYYSAQILFFGAEFTRVYADHFGSYVVPTENAVAVTAETQGKQGMPRREDLEAAAGAKPASPTVSTPPERSVNGAARNAAAAASGSYPPGANGTQAVRAEGGAKRAVITTFAPVSAVTSPSPTAHGDDHHKFSLPCKRNNSKPPKREPHFRYEPVTSTLSIAVPDGEDPAFPRSRLPRIVLRKDEPKDETQLSPNASHK